MTEPLTAVAPEPTPEPTREDVVLQVARALTQLVQIVASLQQTVQLVADQQAQVLSMVHQYQPLLDAATASPIARGLAGLRRTPKVEVH